MSWNEVASEDVPPSVVIAQISTFSKLSMTLLCFLLELPDDLSQHDPGGGVMGRASKTERGFKLGFAMPLRNMRFMRIMRIWVSFCRAGKIAVSCHFLDAQASLAPTHVCLSVRPSVRP